MPDDGDPVSGNGARRTLAAAAAIILACASIPIALGALGTSSRSRPAPSARPEVLLVRSDRDVVGAWRTRRLRGKTVVHAGRFLHFVDEGEEFLSLSAPGSGPMHDDLLAARAAPANYLFVSASTGIARRLFYVSPPRSLRERLAALGATPAALPMRIDAEAIQRTLDGSPPVLDEPVLLDVDASWFDEGTGAELLERMAAAGLQIELVTLSLADDAADVSPTAREALRAFAEALPKKMADGTP